MRDNQKKRKEKEKQEDHVGNQIKKQDNKAFVQRNEKKPDQSGTVGQTNDGGFKEKNNDRNGVCSQKDEKKSAAPPTNVVHRTPSIGE